MKMLLIVLTILLIGCGKTEYLTVEETVRQCKVCDSAGLFYKVNTSSWNNQVLSVICEEKRYNIPLGSYEYAKLKKE